MKILILSWRDIKNPKAGGSEVYFHELARRWVSMGNKVSIICGGWKGCAKHESIDGISIFRTGNEISIYALAPFAYFQLEEKPDVIIDLENGIPFFSPLFSRRKIFLHIHHVHKDVWRMESEGRKLKDKAIAQIGLFLETKIMPRVYRKNEIITISKSSAEEIEWEKFGKVWGIVNPGIEFCKFKKTNKSRTPEILFMNRIKRYKGVKILVDAVQQLNRRKIKLNAVFAGGGDYLDEMRSYAKKNKIWNVSFLGRVSEDKKKELMQKAWIFANPSSKEGWGIVNIEANYFGAPVVGSNVSGIKDSIIDGKTGLLFEYGNSKELADKIEKLIRDKNLRERMGKEGKKWAKKFDWDSRAREYLKILKS